MKNIFKQILSDFHSRELKVVKKRDLRIDLNTWKIISIVWPRRAWKSFYLYWIINDLIKSWVDKDNIIFINFEDERISLDWSELQTLIDAYLEMYNDKDLKKCYFFFDEIQNIDWWEKFVRRIYDEGIENIFITWSNAKLLSKEISTSLRGRSLSYELLPLSFKEYLEFKWEKLNIYTTKGKAKILIMQMEFIKWWWFPEIIDFSESTKIKTLQEYFDVVLYNDIIERYKIKNVLVLKEFVKQLLQSTTSEYSINKIWNNLKSLWLRFDKNDLYDFIDYLDTIYFSKSLSKYEYSLKKQTLKKIYLFDNWFLNAITFNFSDNYWKLLENIVYIELYRKFGENIFFLKNWSETDFILNKEEKIVFQVCYDLTKQNYDREIKWCLDWMNKLKINNSFLITFEQEEKIEVDWKIIYVIPFYKWILEN